MLWREHGKLEKNSQRKQLARTLFLFKFEKQSDREWILENGSWLFDKHILILEELIANQRVSDLEFKEVAFWIRLMNIPLGFRNRSVAEKIGRNLGTFLEYDEEKSGFSWCNSMRMRIKNDISKPIQRGFMLKVDGVKGECWIAIRHERLPDICYRCGRIGHIVKECDEGKNGETFDPKNSNLGIGSNFRVFSDQVKGQDLHQKVKILQMKTR